MNTLQTEFKIPSTTRPDVLLLDPRVVLLGEIVFDKLNPSTNSLH